MMRLLLPCKSCRGTVTRSAIDVLAAQLEFNHEGYFWLATELLLSAAPLSAHAQDAYVTAKSEHARRIRSRLPADKEDSSRNARSLERNVLRNRVDKHLVYANMRGCSQSVQHRVGDIDRPKIMAPISAAGDIAIEIRIGHSGPNLRYPQPEILTLVGQRLGQRALRMFARRV